MAPAVLVRCASSHPSSGSHQQNPGLPWPASQGATNRPRGRGVGRETKLAGRSRQSGRRQLRAVRITADLQGSGSLISTSPASRSGGSGRVRQIRRVNITCPAINICCLCLVAQCYDSGVDDTFNAGQLAVLERLAAGAPLPRLLEDIVRFIERQSTGMVCSILLLDPEERRIRHGAAPSLPPEFISALDGARIGPNAGSCGSAAYLGERIVVSDISAHPNWDDYRHLALPHGFLL